MRSKDTSCDFIASSIEAKRRQVADIETMIGEFLRKQDELDRAHPHGRSRNGVTDPDHFNYSTAAKAARARRDNLLRSVGELKDQLDERQGRACARRNRAAQGRAAGREGSSDPASTWHRPADHRPRRRCAEPDAAGFCARSSS